MVKFDRLHSRRGSYTATGIDKYTNFALTDISTQTTWVALSAGAITLWEAGPGGLQILDMSQAPSTYIPGTYTLTQKEYQYASKTSTIPSPQGKKLLITADVISKFYMRDALYQKIDNVMEFTFSQDIKLTKGAILQQFNSAGVTQAYGTIVEVPTGTLLNPGVGTKYKVCLLYTSPSPRDS